MVVLCGFCECLMEQISLPHLLYSSDTPMSEMSVRLAGFHVSPHKSVFISHVQRGSCPATRQVRRVTRATIKTPARETVLPSRDNVSCQRKEGRRSPHNRPLILAAAIVKQPTSKLIPFPHPLRFFCSSIAIFGNNPHLKLQGDNASKKI